MEENKKAVETETNYQEGGKAKLPVASQGNVNSPHGQNSIEKDAQPLEVVNYAVGQLSPNPKNRQGVSRMAVASLVIGIVAASGNYVLSTGIFGSAASEFSRNSSEWITLATIIMANVGLVLGITARNKGKRIISSVLAIMGIILNELIMLFLVYMMASSISCLRASSCNYF